MELYGGGRGGRGGVVRGGEVMGWEAGGESESKDEIWVAVAKEKIMMDTKM